MHTGPDSNAAENGSSGDGTALLRSILDSAVDGIVTIDDRGIIQSANPAALRLFEYTSDELTGRNIKMLMPSPYCDEHDMYLANYLATGNAKIIGSGREVEGRRKDGTTFPMYLSVGEFKLGSRRLFSGIVHDLNELRQAEQAATRLGRVLEDSLNEIYIFNADSLRFELVNRGARENLGFTMDQLQKMTPIDLEPEFNEEAFNQLVAPLRSGDASVVNFETIHRRRDGTTYPVDVHLQLAQVSAHDVFFAVVLDITERRRAEAERSELTQKLESHLQQLRIRDQALQSAGEGIVIADAQVADFPIIFVNAAFEAMTGYPASEALGQSFWMLQPHETREAVQDDLRQAIEVSTEYHAVLRNHRKDGVMFWNDVSIAPVRVNGVVTQIIGVMEDVTEHRRTQERLVQAERLAAIGEMVTGLAHESRNALQRAQACLDMLTLDLEEQPEQLDLTQRVRIALQDLSRLYEEVRSYATPIALDCRDCRPPEIWRKVWNDLAVVRAERSIELVERIDDSDLRCRLDTHRIEQVFRNVLENAIAACGDTGQIEITYSAVEWRSAPALRIVIRDSGSGIDAEVLRRVFQPFFTTKQKGTGLGMAIARRIVEAHEGQINAGNSAYGGAEFRITLPLERSGTQGSIQA